MNAVAINCMPIPPRELNGHFEVPGPCYTSYPAADRFVEAFSAEQAAQMLAQRRDGRTAMQSPLSIYVHIPFCESLCYYCACDKIITRQHERGRTYLRYLGRELELKTAHLGSGQAVSQLHLGGGSPTFLSDAELAELMGLLRRSFAFQPGAECAIEVDPRTVDAARLACLAELGFNRLSFSVQDFDPAVQKALHRVQPASEVFSLVEAARSLGFRSISVDFIYGLPRQTLKSFEQTLAQVCELRPDRIAFNAYVHLPVRFKPQRRIAGTELPTAEAKLLMQKRAREAFQGAGYIHIGMDLFALPEDSLAVAKRQGRLHRSLQGYGTQPDGDWLGLGMSAMSKFGLTYSQNAKILSEYCDYLDQDCLPVVRGLALSRDDLLRRAVIMALVCQGQVEFESIELSWLIDFKSYFMTELRALTGMQKQGLVALSDSGIEVTPLGEFFVRELAMVFDRYLQADRARARFSRII